MSSKTIGPAGTRLLTTLAERDRPIFSVAEAQAEIGGDYSAVLQTLRRLARAGWVVRLMAGCYAIVPLSSGNTTAPQVNRYVIPRELLHPALYCISHDSAMDIHNMLTRPVTSVTVTSPGRLAAPTSWASFIALFMLRLPPSGARRRFGSRRTSKSTSVIWNAPCWMGWRGPHCVPVSARSLQRYGCGTLTWTGTSSARMLKNWVSRLWPNVSAIFWNCSSWDRLRCFSGCKL